MNCLLSPGSVSLPRSVFAVTALLLLADAAWANPGRFRSGEVSRTGRNGGSVEVQGQSFGRYRSGSVNAEGPNGASYEASGTRVGRFSTGSVDAEGPRGASYSASGTKWNGYRSGYVYTGGVYRPANVVVNQVYVAPLGAYAGWNVIASPVYVAYPQFATYPVEVAVQAQLKALGYYGGPVDGQVGPQTQAAIAKYQAAQNLPATGSINQALLKSLGIV